MKNYLKVTGLLLALSFQHCVLFARGGDAVAGALGGLAIGTMLTSAAHSSNNSKQDHLQRVEDRAEQARIDQERERVARLEREMDRRDMERRLAEEKAAHGGGNMLMILIAVVIILLFGVVALGILVMRRKP
jgi:hypothetical protein